jgi:hypothetical protein
MKKGNGENILDRFLRLLSNTFERSFRDGWGEDRGNGSGDTGE